jgi:hypothetical protein
MEAGEGREATKNWVTSWSNSTVNKVFVALPGEWKAGKSVLNWTLKNFLNNSTIVITHVLVKTSLTNLASMFLTSFMLCIGLVRLKLSPSFLLFYQNREPLSGFHKSNKLGTTKIQIHDRTHHRILFE